MTNTLVIHVHTEPFLAAEIPLMRRATWAIHRRVQFGRESKQAVIVDAALVAVERGGTRR
jgi:hypothetical protein